MNKMVDLRCVHGWEWQSSLSQMAESQAAAGLSKRRKQLAMTKKRICLISILTTTY